MSASPPADHATILVEALAVGICGTDAAIAEGSHGWVEPDIVGECTGVVPLIEQAADTVAAGGIVCLTGVGSSAATPAPESALATRAVLKNLVLFGSVNANRRHYYRAAKALARADRAWLEQLITRRVRPDEVNAAVNRDPDDIEVVMEFAAP